MRSSAELNRLLTLMDVSVQHVAWHRVDRALEQEAAEPGCILVGYVTSGALDVGLPGRGARRCADGATILLPAGLKPFFTPIADEGLCGLVVGRVHVRLSGSGLLDRVNVPVFAPLGASALVRQTMNELVRLGDADLAAMGASPLADSLMKTVILTVLQDFFSRPGIDLKIVGALADPRLATVIAAVLARPQEGHGLKSMSALAGLSRSAFSRLFGAAMGQSPTEFVTKTRLYYAAETLRTGNAPIKAVAVSVGFSSRSHFSRAFRDAFGVDPTAYRASCSADRPPPIPQDVRQLSAAAERTA